MTHLPNGPLAAALVALLALAGGRSAPAQPDDDGRAEAQERFAAGVELMRNEDWDGALAEFERSLDLYPTRNALFNVGMCRKALHEYRAALAVFQEWQTLHGETAPRAERQAVEEAVADLQGYLGSLTITVEPEGAELRVDGEAIGTAPLPSSLTLEVGRHTVEAARDGYATQSTEVMVVSGEDHALALVLEPVDLAVSRPPPSDGGGEEHAAGVAPTWFWVTAGSALGLGIGSAITGVMVGESADDFYAVLAPCQAGDIMACASGLHSADDHDAYQVATYVMLPTAIVAAVATAVLAVYTDWSGDEEEAPSSVGVTAGPTASTDGTFDGLGFGAAVTF